MATAEMSTVLDYLRRIAAPRALHDLPDEQLLERFLLEREEAAFALLVQRHGPLVLAVCRRQLHSEQDAEDAFQATFLILVRRAAAIGKRQSVRSWLHGVAWRVAARAKTGRQARWLAREPLDDLAAAPEPAWDDAGAVLDEELNRLPARYREPFVLCYLEGRTFAETAGRLGCPLGTVAARLHRARERLRRRLARRGVALSAGILGVAWAAQPAFAVPSSLAASTCSAASRWAAGQTATAVLSARVLALTKGALPTMCLTKTTLTTVVLLTLALVVGLGLLTPATPSAGVAASTSAGAAATLKQAAGNAGWKERATLTGHKDQVLSLAFGPDALVSGGKEGALKMWSLDGKELAQMQYSIENHSVDWVTILPDGKQLAVGARSIGNITLIRLEDKKFGLSPGFGFGRLRALGIAPDGKTWAFGKDHDVFLQETDFQIYFNNPNDAVPNLNRGVYKGHTGEPLAAQFSPDGSLLATASADSTVKVWGVTGQRERATCQGHKGAVLAVAFTSDSKMLASAGEDGAVRLWEAGAGKELAVLKSHTGPVRALAFAPDGKTLASAGDDQRVLLWNVANGKQLGELKGHTAPIHALAFSRDGRVFASAGQDKAVKLWEVAK